MAFQRRLAGKVAGPIRQIIVGVRKEVVALLRQPRPELCVRILHRRNVAGGRRVEYVHLGMRLNKAEEIKPFFPDKHEYRVVDGFDELVQVSKPLIRVRIVKVVAHRHQHMIVHLGFLLQQ